MGNAEYMGYNYLWPNEKVHLIITFRIGKVTKGKTG